MELVLIRGLPGSGKSTIAKLDYPNHTHVEADMFFTVNGVYCFDKARIGLAHKWCQAICENSLKNGMDVVVSNTFTQKWEIEPYLSLAQATGSEVKIIVAKGEYQNIHGVPDEAIERMRLRWESF